MMRIPLYEQEIARLKQRCAQLENLQQGRGITIQRGPGGTIIHVNPSETNQSGRSQSNTFNAKITANTPAYTFAEVGYDGATWTTKTGGKTGTAVNIAEIADTDIELVPVDSIVVVYTITSGETKYYVFSRDIGGGVSEEPPALADLIELASTQGAQDTDYWRADLSLATLAYNIDNTTLGTKLAQLINVGGYVGATVSLAGGPAPADVTIEFVGAWDTVPLLVATSRLVGTPNVSVSQVDTTHQKIDFSGNVTGGTFGFGIPGEGGYIYEAVDWNTSNDDLQSIIAGILGNCGYNGDVTVTGGPCPASVTITFEDTDIPLMTATSDLTGNATLAVTQVDATHQTIDFGGTITGGTFDLLMPGHGGDQPVIVRELTDHRYNTSDRKMTYRTRNKIFWNGKPVFIGPESDPETLITTAVVHE